MSEYNFEWNDFIIWLLKKAEKLRDDAGYSGSQYDGGAKSLEDIATTWDAGLQCRRPACLDDYYKEFLQSKDPDFIEYQRLKKKFE